MELNLPKKYTFWISVIIAAVGVVLFIVHLFAPDIPKLGTAGFLLVVVAYALMFLGLTTKPL
jgi:multisubunit Na+/H+ antiporter MnhB subunit